MDYVGLLPHAPPMRLLEEVLELVPGISCRARRVAHPDDFYFQGHFPGNPIVPACIYIELIAQAGGLAAGFPTGAVQPRTLELRVAAVGRCKFPGAARPNTVLDISVRVAGTLGDLYKIEGEVTADGVLVATGDVMLAGPRG
jgi:3-hydroxyacyl-[acyl-carrier-protein] dehydratase